MSKLKRYGLKKLTLFLSLALLVTLGLIGISYGAWNDLLEMDVTVATAEFAPQIEVYKIERERPLATRTFDSFEPITPDANGVITVRVGRSSDDPIPSFYPALRNDKYKIYYRVINNSSIPLDYRTIKQNLTNEQQNYVAVSPTDWTGIGANATADNNYVSMEIKFQPEIKVQIPFIGTKIIQVGINPFGLPSLGLENIDRTLAGVNVKQFNTTTGDLGWAQNVQIRVFTNDL